MIAGVLIVRLKRRTTPLVVVRSGFAAIVIRVGFSVVGSVPALHNIELILYLSQGLVVSHFPLFCDLFSEGLHLSL